jgi:hypothetical protein
VLDDGAEQRGEWAALVSRDTWNRVQRRLVRSDANGDEPQKRQYTKLDERFPWRGVLVCGGCGRRLTGDASLRGKNARLKRVRCYYDCRSGGAERTAGCVRYSPDALHRELNALLARTTLTVSVTPDEVRAAWHDQHAEQQQAVIDAKAGLGRLIAEQETIASRWLSAPGSIQGACTAGRRARRRNRGDACLCR